MQLNEVYYTRGVYVDEQATGWRIFATPSCQ